MEQKQSLKKAIEDVVNSIDTRIRIVGNYPKQLRNSISELLAYLNDLEANVPAPIVINKNAFAENPHLRTFFVNSKEMIHFFSFNHNLRQFLDEHDENCCPEIYAMLCMVKAEKQSFGVGLSGDVVVRDVPQTRINFGGHELHFLSMSEDELRISLKQCLFDSFVNLVRTKMSEDSDYILSKPDRYMKKLTVLLSNPQQRLSIEKNELRINHMGLILSKDANEPANQVELNEVEIDQAPYRVIFPVKIPRSELLPPKDFLKEADHLLHY